MINLRSKNTAVSYHTFVVHDNNGCYETPPLPRGLLRVRVRVRTLFFEVPASVYQVKASKGGVLDIACLSIGAHFCPPRTLIATRRARKEFERFTV